MIRLNITAYLESQGVKLEHGFIKTAADELDINRATLTRYLRRGQTVNSVDLHKLGALCEYIHREFPTQLNQEEMLRGIFVWESFQAAFARLSVTYYLGAVLMSEQSGGEHMTSQRDRSVVDNLHRLHPSENKNVVFVPWRIPRDSSTPPLETDITTARNLMKNEGTAEHHVRVIVGSCKAHLLTILYLMDLFGVDDFAASNEKIPITLAPRSGEVVPGCFINTPSSAPGLLWRNKDNTWETLGFEETETGITKDAGIVVIDFQPKTEELNIILFGFSGAGTEALGQALARKPQKIEWPPTVHSGGRCIDIYAYKFDFDEDSQTHVEVTRMDEAVLQNYLPGPTS